MYCRPPGLCVAPLVPRPRPCFDACTPLCLPYTCRSHLIGKLVITCGCWQVAGPGLAAAAAAQQQLEEMSVRLGLALSEVGRLRGEREELARQLTWLQAALDAARDKPGGAPTAVSWGNGRGDLGYRQGGLRACAPNSATRFPPAD
jgi:hypothetical protein